MQAPTTYRLKISDIESIFGMSAYPLDIEGYDTYLICHSQLPNSKQKKIVVKFTDGGGEGYDVYDYNKDVDYTNAKGQYPLSLGPALIKNIESIYPTVMEMISFTKNYHR